MTGRPRTTQELIHWLEMGGGARWVLIAALLVGGVAVGLVVSWRQFHGATTEPTLVQADLARQLSEGRGFTTNVTYPQEVAYLRSRGVRFDPNRAYPEVYQAPLYSLVVAGALRVLPSALRESLFAAAPPPPMGYGADYLLLAVNLLLFAAAIGLTHGLARRLFGPAAAWLASIGLYLSLPAWQQVVAVNGTALMMVLSLATFHAWWRAESAADLRAAALPLALLGACCALLFLGEYSAGALVLVALPGASLRFKGPSRWKAAGLIVLGFSVVAGPWIARNLAVTGLPTGLAIQNIALKAGDTTAEPSVARATLAAALPHLDVNKLGNKVLTSIQEAVRNRLWSAGAMWFTAFFAAGWLYVFKSGPVNRLRWMCVLALLVLVLSQAAFNSGESERPVVAWMAPLVIVFGAGFFFVLLSSNGLLSSWPRLCAAALLSLQAMPLAHDALDPHWLHFNYPPYFPQLLQGMRRQLTASDSSGRYGLMADVPAGLAWYGRTRVWAQPASLHDFYAVQVEQPTGELLLTPKTLDRPFLSDLNARVNTPSFIAPVGPRIGDWGEVYGGILSGSFPNEFPLSTPRKITDNLYVLFNGALVRPRP